MNREVREKLSNLAYYIIIGLVSVVAMAVVPMIGSEIDAQWALPTTTVGWIVWVATKLAVGIINMLLFHCFLQQAKLNVQNNEKYIKANEILERARIKKAVLPMSPKKWNSIQYGKKGTMIFIFSLASLATVSQAVLNFDILTFMSLASTILMGVIFGYINMRKAEEYWTGEFYEYAVMYENQVEEEIKLKELQKQQESEESKNGRNEETVSKPSGTSPEE